MAPITLRFSWKWAGFALLVVPFLFNFSTGRTFAPMQAHYATNSPYIDDQKFSPPNNHFWVDTTTFYLPRLVSLSRGDFPLSFSSGGGTPLFADTISGYFSPYALMVFRLLPYGAHSLEIFWFLQFFVYYFGIYFWLRRLGLDGRSAFLGAVSQLFCTAFFPGSYLSFQTLGTLSFLPWVLWAEERRSGKAWLPGLFLCLSFFSGNIQTAVYPLMIFSAWMISQGRIRQLIWTSTIGILGSAPLWAVGIEYHMLLNLSTLEQRRSELPPDFLGRLKALLALPAVILPELYGSSKSVDFLKAFSTSATYFIGSVGLLGVLLAILAWRRENFRDRRYLFAVGLVVGSAILMVTPLLDFFYYRVLCVLCFGLSVLIALSFNEVFEIKNRKRSYLALAVAAALALVVIGVVAVGKTNYRAEIVTFFSQRLGEGNYAWLEGLIGARIDRWFSDYLSSTRIIVLPLIFLGAAIAVARKMRHAVVALIVVDLILLWLGQVTFDRKGAFEHKSYSFVKERLAESAFFPLSRFMFAECERGPYTFQFAINEYQGVPSAAYYGSTYIDRLPIPIRSCDPEKKLVLFDHEQVKKSAVNILITYPGWKVEVPGFKEIKQSESYVVWQNVNPYPAIAPIDGAPGSMKLRGLSTSGWGLEAALEVTEPLNAWYISVPFHRDWRFEIDGMQVRAERNKFNLPQFNFRLEAGEHRVTAKFIPIALLYGFLGSLMAILLALWKLISTPAST